MIEGNDEHCSACKRNDYPPYDSSRETGKLVCEPCFVAESRRIEVNHHESQ